MDLLGNKLLDALGTALIIVSFVDPLVYALLAEAHLTFLALNWVDYQALADQALEVIVNLTIGVVSGGLVWNQVNLFGKL
jgi:hypothetical protein